MSTIRSITAALLLASTWAYPDTNQFQSYLSRPDLSPPKFEFTIYDEAKVSPGYLLMTPITAPIESSLAAGTVPDGITLEYLMKIMAEAQQAGPLIFTEKDGNGIYGAQNLKLTEFEGQPHLSFWQGSDQPSGTRGFGAILDSSYNAVATVHAGLGRAELDSHELTILPGGTALFTLYQPAQYDLTSYGIDQPWGWVLEGIFQEIDIATGEVLFEWKSLDHVDPSESYNPDNSNVIDGNGTSVSFAWDYFHMNSVTKFANGDYLMNSRYTCTIYRIDGRTGAIKWRLGGKSSDFTLHNFTAPFAFQHHPRIHSENETTLLISLFDNASDGTVTRSPESSAMLIALDTAHMTATLQTQFFYPGDGGGSGLLSTSQGSAQVLRNNDNGNGNNNGNVLVGWGAQPYLSEYTPDGTCVMAAQFASNTSLSMNYRAFKIARADWVGRPKWSPAVWSYANDTTGATEIYASWNGATEVVAWRFYAGDSEEGLRVVGTKAVDGFETAFVAQRGGAWAMAEALDGRGKRLGVSPVQRTYVVGEASYPAGN